MTMKAKQCSVRNLLFFLAFTILSLASSSYAQKTTTKKQKEDIVQSYMEQLRDQYEKLPDQGKFATGSVVGFGASKMVVKSAVTFVKVAGAAFVA
jgi:hypothetical protein